MNKILIGEIMCGIGIGIVFSAAFSRIMNGPIGIIVGMALGCTFALAGGALFNRRR